MSLEGIQHIGIIGAGTMGQGIAQVTALAGFKVTLFDIDVAVINRAYELVQKNLKKGIEKGKFGEKEAQEALSLIEVTTDFTQLSGDFIIEAAVEDAEIKKQLFEKLEQQLPSDVIFATNTSSISITQIAAGLNVPERVVGMHFFNPAYIMKLVEVISGAATSKKVAEVTKALAVKLGKKPVKAKDSPGFIVNRIARLYYVESLKVLEEGVADHETIDALLENCGFKMGPFRLMDLIGVDTNLSVTKSMYESFQHDSKFRPSRIQQKKVDAGHNGRKSGLGFYKYNVR